MGKFSAVLSRPMADVAEPKNVPEGTWELELVSAKATEPKTVDGEERSGFILVTHKPITPGDDVSTVEIEAAGGMEAVLAERIFTRFYLRDRRDEWNVKKMLEAHGVDSADWDEAFEQAKGQRAMAYVEHSPNKNDPEKPYVSAKLFAPVE